MLRSVKHVPRAAIFVFLFFFCSDAEVSIERIEICLSAYTKEDSTNAGKKSTKLFHLHFGDPVVEVLNALTSFDALRIKALSNCVKQEDSFLFEESKAAASGTLIHQGNTTYLTGIFQRLLPDVIQKLQIAAQHGIDGAGWSTSVSDLGIRTVQYSAIDSFLKMKSKALLAKEKREKVHVFSIGGGKVAKVDDGIVDIHADEHVLQFMRREMGSVYTMIVNLSQRTDFFGGIVLIGKEIKNSSDDAIDIEEEDSDIFDTSNDSSYALENVGNIKPEFSAFHTKIQRYTPEFGSALLIRSESAHGIHKVTRGQLKFLVLEFWAYRDAPVGSKCNGVEDAESLFPEGEL